MHGNLHVRLAFIIGDFKPLIRVDSLTERNLLSIRNTEKAVGVLSLVVHIKQHGIALEKVLAVHEEVERACLGKLDALADDVIEVVSGEIDRHEVPAAC